ncbi:MAG: hypothetical protein ACI4MC_06120 [Candidatus Coproplasma sp.]
MAEKNKNRSRSRNNGGSSSVGVGIIAFLLGFLFAIIVLIGSIFGVGYVAVTTDINEVLELFGLANVNESYDETDPDSNKYNYINADQAPNILALITEVMKMADDGLGELNLNKIDALAPVTDAVLDIAYGFIDEVVDFDKDYFEDVPLTSIIDSVTNSLYYIHASKIIDLLNDKMGYSVSLDDIPIASYLINGVEANYATVKGGNSDGIQLPVLFDYYVDDGSAIGYSRNVADPDGVSAYPDNLSGDLEYIHETTLKDGDDKTLYKVYYVPCRVTSTGIEEAEYKVVKNVKEDPNVSFSKNGETVNLKYVFRTIGYGEDTDFIAVKSELVNGVETFELDYDAIYAAKNTASDVTASNRYIGYSYYDSYARNYYYKPQAREENDRIFGVTTLNGINYFKNLDGEMVEYDPLLVSDIMLNAYEPLNNVPVSSVVNSSQTEVVRGIFGDTSLGDVLNQNVNYNELVNNIRISTLINDVQVDDRVMPYIVYNITNVRDDGYGNYTATYGSGDDKKTVRLEVENSSQGIVIKSVIDPETGKELEGNTVEDLTNLTTDITLDIFLDVKATDAIMTYLGYGITDVVAVTGQDWNYTGICDNRTVLIYTDGDGVLIKAVYEDTGRDVSGTTIDGVSDRLDNIMDVLTLPDFLDIDATDAIMAYLGYGVYDVVENAGENNGNTYTHTGTYDSGSTEVPVYIATDDSTGTPVITSVWLADGTAVSGTKISNVSDRLENISDTIAVTEFIGVDPTDAILAYMGYGINNVTAETGTDSLGNGYTYKATYKDEYDVEFDCYITVDGEGEIDEVWYIDGGVKVAVKGTKIGAVSDRISSLKDSLTIGEIITVDESSSKILQALKDTTVNSLDAKIKTLTVSDVLTEEQINANSIIRQVRDKNIFEISEEIDKVLIQRIYAANVYGVAENADPTLATTYNSEYLYYERTGNETDGYKYEITTVGCAGLSDTAYDNAVGKLTAEQFAAGEYYTYGPAIGMWKLVLYRIDGNTKTEKAYTLNNFNNMVNSCAETVYNSTLGELQEANIISESTNLDKYMKLGALYITVDSNGSPTTTANQSEANKMSELTLKQLLDVVITFMGSES